MLDNYHALVASLDESETQLLDEQLHELKRTIRPGAKRLNWNALGIIDYLSKCNSVTIKIKIFFWIYSNISILLKNISKMESMINQIKKNSKDIQTFLHDIESINLFLKPESISDNSITPCKVSSVDF